MGTCGTKLTKEEKMQLMISKQIDKQATEDYRKDEKYIKILLLGPGESGKSTLLKQMNTLYSTGYTDAEVASYVHVIRENLLDNFKTILEMSDLLETKGIEGTKVSAANEKIKEDILTIGDLEEGDESWKIVCEKIDKLWKSEPGLKVVYENKSSFQLPGSGDYFFNKAMQVGEPTFTPTFDDILRARVRTTGITEKLFKIEKTNFKVIDVGGQRNERKKWIHCFEDVTCVIFLVSLAGYDEFLYEDETVPRMKEALDLFQEISNGRYFKKTSFVLFLNKSDLFRQKIQKVPLKRMFDDYDGPESDYDASVEFIKSKFLDLVTSKDKPIYTHVTCATDNKNIELVLSVLTDFLIKDLLAQGGLLF